MYKIMIVDDETIIRDGIINNVDFQGLGMDVVGSCENGIEALEVFRSEEPDIVITDINMPFMNGIELAEEILEHKASTKIIILTGYDKFEYAQQALKLKITDYIVKPILPRELNRVFEKVIQSIRQDRLQDETVIQLKEQLAETGPVMKARFLNRLISRPIDSYELKGKMVNHDIHLNADYYQILHLQLRKGDDEQDYNWVEMALVKVLGLTNHQLEPMSDCLTFRTYLDNVIVIVGSDTKEDLNDTTRLLAERLVETTKLHHNIAIGIGIGKSVSRLERLYESAKTAEEAFDYHMFNGSGNIISYSDQRHHHRKRTVSVTSFASKLYKEVRVGSADGIKDILNDAFAMIEKHALPIDSCYIHIQNLIMSILLSIEDQGIDYKDINRSQENPTIKLYDFKSIAAIKSWMTKMCDEIFNYVAAEREDYQQTQANQAIAFIEANYMKQDMSLKHICKALSMSVSYFSVLFKEATGTTFVEYLTKVRMDKAKELLRNTNDKTYVIAESVGYKDAHYFSLVFKKRVGMNATAFRESTR